MPDDAIARRIRHARCERGFDSPRAAARALGWNENTTKSHENGVRGVPLEEVRKYARAYGVTPEWIAFGSADATAKVPLVGRVGAGGEVIPSEADDVDYVDMPPGGSPDLEALEVVNGSMQPVYRSGDYLFVSPADDGTPLDKLVGLECVVQCEDDRRLVKVLRKGTGPGLWRLESYNPAVDDIEDVRVVKAMPVRHVTRRLSV